jgi:hypothetical protein
MERFLVVPSLYRSVSAWRIAMKLRFCRSDAHRGRVGPGNFTPSRSQIPDVNLSIHSARVPRGRLPPSVETSAFLRLPVDPIDLDARDLPPSLHGNCPGSSLLRSSPSLAAHPYFRPHGAADCAFSFSITDKVLEFRSKARSRVMPFLHRTPHSQ